MPGLFARVRIPFDKSPDMPLVTERAIGFDQSGQYILVVNAENAVEKRNVSLGRILDGLRVITSGVEAGDLVVVNGLQRAREGAEVEAEQIDMATLTASAIEEAADAGEEVQDKATAPSDDLTLSGLNRPCVLVLERAVNIPKDYCGACLVVVVIVIRANAAEWAGRSKRLPTGLLLPTTIHVMNHPKKLSVKF
jgi:hypothetical protein